MSIKDNIKRLRIIYGLTQQDLADIAGVTNKAVSAWESGLSEPRMGAIERIAQRFKIKKSNIIEDGGMDDLSKLEKNTIDDLSDFELFTVIARRMGHATMLDDKDIEQIKLALKIALASNQRNT